MSEPYQPYQPPASPARAPGELRGDRAYLLKVATYQKGILLCILASIFSVILQAALPAQLRVIGAIASVAISVASVVFVVMLARTFYNLAVAVLFALLTFVPCVGLIALFIINQKATSTLRSAGLQVGLLGVDLAKLR